MSTAFVVERVARSVSRREPRITLSAVEKLYRRAPRRRSGSTGHQRVSMNRMLIGGTVVAAGVYARRWARGRRVFDFERMIERMPEEAPPKWMFLNISAIRANTERILELIDTEPTRPVDERAAAPA